MQYIYVCVYANMYMLCIYVYVCVCGVYMCVHMCVYIYVYVCVCMCVFTYMCVYMYVYTSSVATRPVGLHGELKITQLTLLQICHQTQHTLTTHSTRNPLVSPVSWIPYAGLRLWGSGRV